MPTVQELWQKCQTILAPVAADAAHWESQLILAQVLQIKPSQIVLYLEQELAEPLVLQAEQLVNARAAWQPLQYLLGQTEFMSLPFNVTPVVLIPRPDTEPVVEKALKLLNNLAAAPILVSDIGTGSGAIAISIAKYQPKAQVLAVDISSQALTIAKANAQLNQVDKQVRFACGNLLEPLHTEPLQHLIISNPPYVAQAELLELPPDVLHEPELALNGGLDGLDFYRQLALAAPAKLAPGGWLLVEIGSTQKTVVMELWQAAGLVNLQSGQDYNRLDRWVAGQKPALP